MDRCIVKLAICMIFLLLLQNLDLVVSSRSLIDDVPRPPILLNPSGSLMVMPKPLTSLSFIINRYKLTDSDAFRPTEPGHSPGVGHDNPPIDAP